MPNTIDILANTPSQSFNITLDGHNLNMQLRWNTRSRFWTLDIVEKNVFQIFGIALKVGLDLLEPFNFDIGALIVIDITNTNQEMNLNNVGSDSFLVHFTKEEIENV